MHHDEDIAIRETELLILYLAQQVADNFWLGTDATGRNTNDDQEALRKALKRHKQLTSK